MSLGNLLPPWHQFLDQKIRGAYFSLGIVAGERFAIELTPSTFPQRHFAGDRFPQRHVAGEMVGMLLGKASNVVVSLKVPVVVRLEGKNVDQRKRILKESGMALITAEDLDDAAEKAVKALKSA
ncbi:succinate--CoA ligase [ADP-forming] subunit beta, mitochondrial [Tanacetum coccineum]